MSPKREMKRSKQQSLYRYLPGAWIDFSVREGERTQFTAKVLGWRAYELEGINAKRIMRTVDGFVGEFRGVSRAIEPDEKIDITNFTPGFDDMLTKENCLILTPVATEDAKDGDTVVYKCDNCNREYEFKSKKQYEANRRCTRRRCQGQELSPVSGITAHISPLAFYCKSCKKVYIFKKEEELTNFKGCSEPECGCKDLGQLPMVFYRECGYATDNYASIKCADPAHGQKFLKWDGKSKFTCTECGRQATSVAFCNDVNCKENSRCRIGQQLTLDPKQMFAFHFDLLDLIDEKTEDYITEEPDAAYLAYALYMGKIDKAKFDAAINDRFVADPRYQSIYEEELAKNIKKYANKTMAENMAKMRAKAACGSALDEIISEVKGQIKMFALSAEEDLLNTPPAADDAAENILEYELVAAQEGSIDLNQAAQTALDLNTITNVEKYKMAADKYGIKSARVCDDLPFVSCTYGYTRMSSSPGKGVRLRAFDKRDGCNVIYATKLNTEGVLFEFDRRRIIKWLLKNGWIDIQMLPDPNNDTEEEIKAWFINEVRPYLISRYEHTTKTAPATYYVYKLIHTISHLLIKAAADIGGLGADSLTEYIFPSVPAVLIYCQNSQGFNLGALYNTFEAAFHKWLDKAYEKSLKCVFDPMCIDRQDAACTACLYLKEISCCHFNKDLDRGLVTGRTDRRTHERIIGFWED